MKKTLAAILVLGTMSSIASANETRAELPSDIELATTEIIEAYNKLSDEEKAAFNAGIIEPQATPAAVVAAVTAVTRAGVQVAAKAFVSEVSRAAASAAMRVTASIIAAKDVPENAPESQLDY